MVTPIFAVTCETCGNRHRMERTVTQPEVFHMICHSCEMEMRIEVTAQDLGKSAVRPLDLSVWNI